MSDFRTLLAALLLLAVSVPAAGQETDEPGGDSVAEEPAAVDEEADADGGPPENLEEIYDFEISDLDEQTYEEEDDDFVPTEEIPADEPIPFPTDI